MTAETKSHPQLERLISPFADWLKRRRELNELHQLDDAEFSRIASDLQISPDDLDTLVEKGPHAADELVKLLQALGIDEARLSRTQPLLLRDMERVCAMCGYKRECDHDIKADTSAEHYEDYCPNASTIDSLDETTH